MAEPTSLLSVLPAAPVDPDPAGTPSGVLLPGRGGRRRPVRLPRRDGVALGNSDDHLRNHGFLADHGR